MLLEFIKQYQEEARLEAERLAAKPKTVHEPLDVDIVEQAHEVFADAVKPDAPVYQKPRKRRGRPRRRSLVEIQEEMERLKQTEG